MIDRDNKKYASFKPFFLLFALIVMTFMPLGFLRFSAAQQESQLNAIERSIVRYTLEETELRQALSALTSPIRIYSFCIGYLGMVAGTQEVIHVRNLGGNRGVYAEVLPQPEPMQDWRTGMFAFFGLVL